MRAVIGRTNEKQFFNLTANQHTMKTDSFLTRKSLLMLCPILLFFCFTAHAQQAFTKSPAAGFSIAATDNTGEFLVNYALQDGESGVIEFYTQEGLLLCKNELEPGQKQVVVNTPLLPGVYMCRILVNGKTKLVQKLVLSE
jgi:hypothetical protein